jgi:DNA-binding NarL/FixJ family response regulator
LAETIRVLLADDHAIVRRGLRLFLGLQPDIAVVGEAADGAEAVERAAELHPDVVVMDLAMPGIGGVEATERLRTESPDARVLVLSSFSGEDSVLPALRAGALGYLTKDSSPEEVSTAIRSVSRGEPVLCAAATRRLLDGFAGRVRPHGTVTVAFTDIENSSGLVESLGDARARQVFRAHDELVRSELSEHDGVEVEQEGDSFMLAFAGARQAVQCGIGIQRRLAAAGDPVRVRIGLNTGDVISEDDGYFGRTVFVASRVASVAGGCQILAAEPTRLLAEPGGASFRDHGSHRLKGLKGDHRLFEVLWRDAPP